LPFDQFAWSKQKAQEGHDPGREGRKLRSHLCRKRRKDVKLRTVEDGKHYSTINGGQPISVAEWLTMACSTFDPETVGKTLKDSPITGVETQTVTIEGFLMAARFENGEDHDIHAEIATSLLGAHKTPCDC
jgi:hypothetical protein